MFRYHLNHARVTFTLEPEIPFLIQSGDKGAAMIHAELADITPLRARGRDGQPTVLIPGSSLKGMFRAASERLLRTVGRGDGSGAACDPLNQRGRCHRNASRTGNDLVRDAGAGPHRMGKVHRMLCYGCRTFGSQAIASRVRFADAFPADEESLRVANLTEQRSQVAIDRKTGGPAGRALRSMETVPGGAFRSTIHLENFQIWQVALLARVLRDVDEGFVRLGSSKTRGLGHVRVGLEELLVGQIGPGDAVAGVAAIRPDLVEEYGLVTPDSLPEVPPGAESVEELPPFHRWVWRGADNVRGALDRMRGDAWQAFLAAIGGGE